jgi:hypothetical protein
MEEQQNAGRIGSRAGNAGTNFFMSADLRDLALGESFSLYLTSMWPREGVSRQIWISEIGKVLL